MRGAATKVLVALLLGLAPCTAEAIVAFDAVGTQQNPRPGTSASIPITIGSGTNLALVVGFVGGADTLGVSVSGAGATWAVVANTDGGATTGTVMWVGTGPTSGAQTVSVTWTTSQNVDVNAVSFTGVNQSTPTNNGLTQTSSGANISIAVTTSNGDLTTTAAETGSNWNTTTGTFAWTSGSAPLGEQDYHASTGASFTHTLTTASGTASIFASAANIRQVAAGGQFFRDAMDMTGTGVGGPFFKTRPE